MTTQAVTPSASAAEREPASVFLPRDRNYRMTGEMPADKEPETAATQVPEDEPQTADTEEASAASEQHESETAAASEAAQVEQQPEKKSTKTPQTSESRWAKLSRENRELRDRLARLEGRAEATPERKQESQPAAKAEANPRPKLDDVDKDGKPKYATYEAYEAAKDEWLQQEAIRKFTADTEKRQRETQLEQAKKKVSEEWGKRVQAAKAKYADFEEVALNNDLPIKEGSVVDAYILSRPNGADVLYHLGQNPSILDELNAMSPIDAAYKLAEIEFGLTAASAAAPKKVTSAPRPPRQVSGQSAVIKDATTQALQDGDVRGYMREKNESDPRLEAVRRSRKK